LAILGAAVLGLLVVLKKWINPIKICFPSYSSIPRCQSILTLIITRRGPWNMWLNTSSTK
jgi:hypothetical protein